MKGLLKGLGVTFSTAMRRPVTVEYPDERHALPVRARSFPVLTWDFDHDEPYCTGCMVCVRNCPVECMTAVMGDNPHYAEGTSNRRKGIEKFWIDYGRCMRCNICVEVCNFEAIVMDNTWGGHEHAAYDRRDLHLDLDDLLSASRSGRLPRPFRPIDELEAAVKAHAGEEIPEPSMKGARPEARQAQLDRIAAGKAAAIQEREPEKPKVQAVAATVAAAGADAGDVPLSPTKLRAKRMRAEREAREKAIAEGQDPEAAVAAVKAEFEALASGTAAPAAAPPRAAAPAGGAGDPNSPNKVRARRMRAEREAREAAIAAGQDPEAAEAAVRARFEAGETGGAAPTAAAAPAPPTPAAAAPAPAPASGGAGDPNSANKLRARRMREERTAREAAIAAGEDPEAAVAAVRKKWGLD